MISRIQNINFKGQQKSNEQNRFSISMPINSPKQDEIISDIVNSDIQENYPKSRMLEKFASIYEKSNKPKIANSLYRKAVDLKEIQTHQYLRFLNHILHCKRPIKTLMIQKMQKL